MATQSRSINLTPFFLGWSAVFIFFALADNNMSLLWLAAAPWFLVTFFVLAGFAFVWVSYMKGHPVTITTPRKGTRRVQRGRKNTYLVRR